jgi:hypothetical protein
MQSTTPNFTAGPHDAVIRVFDEAGNVIETPEHAGDFKSGDFFAASRYTSPFPFYGTKTVSCF